MTKSRTKSRDGLKSRESRKSRKVPSTVQNQITDQITRISPYQITELRGIKATRSVIWALPSTRSSAILCA
jgi:uncharacterized protein (DUF1499 family)